MQACALLAGVLLPDAQGSGVLDRQASWADLCLCATSSKQLKLGRCAVEYVPVSGAVRLPAADVYGVGHGQCGQAAAVCCLARQLPSRGSSVLASSLLSFLATHPLVTRQWHVHFVVSNLLRIALCYSILSALWIMQGQQRAVCMPHGWFF